MKRTWRASASLRARYERATEEAKDYFLEHVPHVTAIWVRGSVARGEPGPYSDIDMMIVLDQERVRPKNELHSRFFTEYSRFFNECLVRVEETTGKSFRQDHLSKYDERFFWKLRSLRESRILYDPTGLVKETIRRMNKISSDPVAQGHVVAYYFGEVLEFVGKLKNALAAGDAMLAKYSARMLAWSTGEIIIALNGIAPKSDNTFVKAVLGARVKPNRFKTDFLEALGYGTRASNPNAVGKSALAVASKIYLLLRHTFRAKATSDLRSLLTNPEVKNLLSTNY